MIINQRDVVEVYFPFPDGENAPHPVIVLSIPTVLDCEKTFVCIPISHSDDHYDEMFSFPLYNSDFDNPLKHENSCARMHLITSMGTDQLSQKRVIRTMKEESFARLITQIQELIFGLME